MENDPEGVIEIFIADDRTKTFEGRSFKIRRVPKKITSSALKLRLSK